MKLKLLKKPIFLSLLITIAIPNYLFIIELDNLQILLNFKHLLFQINLFLSLSVLLILFKLMLAKDKLDLFFNFSIIWVFFSGVLIPVAGRFDPFLNQGFFLTNLLQLIFQVIIVTIILYVTIYNKKIKNLITNFLIAYTFLLIIFSSYILIDNKIVIDAKKNQITNFNTKNFIVIGFDGLHQNFKNVVKYTELKDILKDFTIYENYTVSHPRTRYSLTSEFYDMTNINNENDIKKIINENKLNKILKNNVSLQTYGYYNKYNSNDEKYFRGDILENKNFFYSNYFVNQLFLPSLSRWLTPKIYTIFDNYKKRIIYQKFLTLMNLKSSFDENLETDYKTSLEDYNNFVKNINLKDKNNDDILVKLLHFEFTHWPVLFDDKCKNKENDSNWNKLNPITQNDFMNKCISDLIKRIITKLKDENVYDNSYIIIKGDHGKPDGYYKKNTTEAIKIKDSNHWVFGRYKTLLMTKKINAQNDSLEINSENSNAGINLKNIYCEEVFECNNTDYSHIFLPESKDSFLKLKDFKKYKITNQDNIFVLMKTHNRN